MSIRDGNYKRVDFSESQDIEFHDLRVDFGEENNLAQTDRDIAGDLHRKLRAWQEEVEALIPRRNANCVEQPPSVDLATD